MKLTPEHHTIHILGTPYSIISDEPEIITKLAQDIEKAMQAISAKTGSDDMHKLAVLVAIQLAHRLREVELTLQKKEQQEALLTEKINQHLAALSLS